MNKNRGRRYDETPKLNKKKVIATVIAIIVFLMIIVSLKGLLTSGEQKEEKLSFTEYKTSYENGKWGVIDTSGKKVINTEYDEMIIIPDETKDIFICTYDIDYNNETYKTKVLDKNGKNLFESYNNIEPLENTDGLAIWYEKNVLRHQKEGKYGLINFEGKEVLKPEYDKIYSLEGTENCLIIEKNGKKGLFNTAMEEITIEPEYTDIECFLNNYEKGFIVKNESNKFGVISADKSKVFECKYDEIKNITDNNYYVVVENNELKIINSTGKVILNTGFDSVEEIGVDSFVIVKDGKYGIIDVDGKTIIDTKYEKLSFSISNYYIAQKNQKYGIINKNNEEIVNFEYNSINYINTADLFKAEKDNYTTDVYDRNFNKKLEEVIISELNLDDGYLRVRKNNEYKYYNFKFEEKSNKEILVKNTLFLVKENGKFGYENKDGEQIVDCIYDDAKEQNEFGFCAVNKDGVWGALKSDGTIVVNPSVNLDEYLYIDFISEWHRYNDLKLNIYTK